MQPFSVDEEVVGVVWNRANPKPFEQLTFNVALRRVLGLPEESAVRATPKTSKDADGFEDLEALLTQPTRERLKAPKADLAVLIKAGYLRNGEKLYLVDYQSQRVPSSEASISGNYLEFKGRHFTMSKLAQQLLTKLGFKSEAVRGPAHWVNAKGASVMVLWQQYLEKLAKK
jgi:hypothetical protein